MSTEVGYVSLEHQSKAMILILRADKMKCAIVGRVIFLDI